jgi:hypothetical protein
LTDQQNQEIIELYRTKQHSLISLTRKYNISRGRIYRLLKKNNMKQNGCVFRITGPRPLTEQANQERLKIIELYKTGQYSCIELGKLYNRCEKTIGKIIRNGGLKGRSNSLAARKYPIKEDFFDNIDTQEKVYFLGFLYADGNNTSNGRVSMSLQERDVETLRLLNNLIQPTKPLYYNKTISKNNKNHQNQYCLIIDNKHVNQRLNELGMVKAKSLVITFPKWLNKDLTRHFIRGFFDGNGSIGIDKNYNIQIVSTLSFCESIKRIIYDILSIESYVYIDKDLNPIIRRFKIRKKKDMLKFLDWIYQDSTIHLQRKYEKYLILKNSLNIQVVK